MTIHMPVAGGIAIPREKVASRRWWNLRGGVRLLIAGLAVAIAAVFIVRHFMAHPAATQTIATGILRIWLDAFDLISTTSIA